MIDDACTDDGSKMSGSISQFFEMKIVNETHINLAVLISISINSVTCFLELLLPFRRDVGILKSVSMSGKIQH